MSDRQQALLDTTFYRDPACSNATAATGLLDRQRLWGGARFAVATEGGEWVPVAPMSCERGSLGVAAVGGQLIACGGGVPHAQYDSVEMCAHGGLPDCLREVSVTRPRKPAPASCAFCDKHVWHQALGGARVLVHQ